MADFSFDIVSEVDFQEIDNAVNQTKKEMMNRFDFRGTKSSIEFDKTEKNIKIIADDDLKLRNIHDILKTRMAARKIPIKALVFDDPEKAFEGNLRQQVSLVSGIEQDKAKIVIRAVKDSKLKVQTAIQEDKIRVTSRSKDELQSVIALVRNLPIEIPLQFTNFRG